MTKAERSWIPNEGDDDDDAAAATAIAAAAAAAAAAASSSSPSPPLLQPPPCPPLVQRWRDSTRVWPCHLYAYAAPTPAALRALRDVGGDRWLEAGFVHVNASFVRSFVTL